MREIPKIGRARGRVTAPSSKSYTNRALLLACITEGETRIEHPLDCDDARFMLEAIKAIGYETGGTFGQGLTIGERTSIWADERRLYLGNAGTAMRFLAGFLAFTPGRFILEGDERMHERPIGDLVLALRQIETEVEYVDREGFPPLRLRGRMVRGGFDIGISGALSSQFVSSLMMAGAKLPAGLSLTLSAVTSKPYIEMTRDILTTFGGRVTMPSPDRYVVHPAKLSLPLYDVEGDYSSASYWFAAAAATAGEVTVDRLRPDSAQGDARFLEVLETMGCSVTRSGDAISVGRSAPLRGGSFDCNAMPDIVPTLAAIAPLATSPVEITNTANLRIKESDRIAAVAAELRKLGGVVEERPDGMKIEPGWSASPATIDPHGDHRLAMAFAIAGLARGGVSIDSERVVSKSYPRFWKSLDELLLSSEPASSNLSG